MEKSWKINGHRLNTKPTYGDDEKYIKTKIKTHEDNITTNFCKKKKGLKSAKRKNTT